MPLAWGGSDGRANKQGLCDACHDAKSREERGSKVIASTHPEWLRPSITPLVIVCGPPCSGKTTYVAKHCAPGDTVIDLDTIFTELDPSYEHWSELGDTSLLNEALRVRNAMLGELSRSYGGGAWLIVAAPTAAERAWWQQKLGGTVVLLQPDRAELERRAIARGTPAAIEGIERWFASARLPWARSFRRRRS